MAKDWTGNGGSIYRTLGASNHCEGARADNDYYVTSPRAVELLLELEEFDHEVWEPACGKGHISKVLEAHGYNVTSSDIIDRGYGDVADFLKVDDGFSWSGDIITNPPYKYAREFVEKAMQVIGDGHKVAMFLKVQFLEGKSRRKMFEKYPPRTVYVSSSRLACAKNGVFDENWGSSAACHCWFVWEKGYRGTPGIRWFN